MKISQVRTHLLLQVPASDQERHSVSFGGKNTLQGRKSVYKQSQIQKLKSS